jgi:IS30 family transposase
MPCRLRREEVVTIRVLSEKHVPARAIARQLGVAESTVRYHLQRAHVGAADGRKEKPFAAVSFQRAIDAWLAEHGRAERPVNSRDLYEHLVRVHGYVRSYKSVLRYVRRRFGFPQDPHIPSGRDAARRAIADRLR